jgi:acyl-CoA thioesterase-1
MNPIVFHIASGQAFFTGIMLLCLAAVSSNLANPWIRRAVPLATVIGTLAVLLSSTPVPVWSYGVTMAAIVVWISSVWTPHRRKAASIAVVMALAIMLLLELPWHFTPRLQPAYGRSLAVIGDSVTAGMGEHEAQSWPGLYAAAHDVKVQDLSEMGETAGSALKRVRREEVTAHVVLLEIGGNDLLGGTTAADFERNLDGLLTTLRHPDRQLIMFELPLPPFRHEYGYIQRRLARKHQVSLVPKRVFLGILAGQDSTLDTIHLSQAGHERMADCVWGLTEPAFLP